MYHSSSESSIEHGNFPSVINLYAAGQQFSQASQTGNPFANNGCIITDEESAKCTRAISPLNVVESDGILFGSDRSGSCGSPPTPTTSDSESDSSDDTFVRNNIRRNSTTSTSTNSSAEEKIPKGMRLARARSNGNSQSASTQPTPGQQRRGIGSPTALQPGGGMLVMHSPLIHGPSLPPVPPTSLPSISSGNQPPNIIASSFPNSNTMSSGGSNVGLGVRSGSVGGASGTSSGGTGYSKLPSGRHLMVAMSPGNRCIGMEGVCPIGSVAGLVSPRMEGGIVRRVENRAGVDSGISNTSPETQSSTEFHPRNIDIVHAGKTHLSGLQHSHSTTNQNKGSVQQPPPQSILKVPRDNSQSHATDPYKAHLFNIASIIYATLLLVLGFILPVSEVVSPLVPLHSYEGFYIYLYSVSILFLCYVYAYLLRSVDAYPYQLGNLPPSTTQWNHPIRDPGQQEAFRMTSFSLNRSFLRPGSGPKQDAPTRRKVMLLQNLPMYPTAGNFYLRLGALGFGIASMIRDGLLFGRVLDSGISKSGCNTPLHAARHILSIAFTFIQLYFIFLNSKISILKFKVLARFGLMHMIATNICVWLRIVLKEGFLESRNIIQRFPTSIPPSQNLLASSLSPEPTLVSRDLDIQNNMVHSPTDATATFKTFENGSIMCMGGELMGNVMKSANPYLYPCTVQYSLVASAILLITWHNIGRFLPPHTDPSSLGTSSGPATTSSITTPRRPASVRGVPQVDCSGSNRGLFLGLSTFVAALVSLITFCVLVQRPQYLPTAICLIYSTEIGLCSVSALASVVACFSMQDLLYEADRDNWLDEVLLGMGLFGVFLHSLTCILVGRFVSSAPGAPFIIVAGLVGLLDACIQTIFVLTSLRRSSYKAIHERQKPGRELVSYLMVSNLSMWALHLVNHLRVDAVGLQARVLGSVLATVLTQFCLPLVAFFRFQLAVCLAIIWRRAYRVKTT